MADVWRSAIARKTLRRKWGEEFSASGIEQNQTAKNGLCEGNGKTLEKRDRERWELKPASSEDYPERVKRSSSDPTREEL